MEYNWDIKDFVSDLKELENILKNTKDAKERYKIIQAIGQVNCNINEINSDENDTKSFEYEMDECYSNYVDEYYDFFPYQKLMNSFKMQLNEDELDIFSKESRLNALGVDEFFCCIHDFYKDSSNVEMFNVFQKLYNDRRKNFKISGKNIQNIGGYMFFTPYLNKAYIHQIISDDFSCELATCVHEYGHAIAAYINNSRYTGSNYIREIESLFFEVISFDYFSKYFNDKSFYTSAYSYMIDYHDDMLGVSDVEKYIKKYIELSHNGIVLQNCSKKQKQIFGKYLNAVDLKTEYKYIVSYIVATNLYTIYLEDKKTALDILKMIILSTNENEYENIINNVGEKSYILKYKSYLDNKLNN